MQREQQQASMHLPGMRTYTILHAREHRQLYQIFPIMAVAIMEKT